MTAKPPVAVKVPAVGTVGISAEAIDKEKWGWAYFPIGPRDSKGKPSWVRHKIFAVESIRVNRQIIVVKEGDQCVEFQYTRAKKKGVPIARVGRYSGSEQTYQEVVKWTVSTGKSGELKEVSMVSDTLDKTYWKLTVGDDLQFEDKIIQASLTLPFPDNKLSEKTVVLLECKSSDGSSITADGMITGREY